MTITSPRLYYGPRLALALGLVPRPVAAACTVTGNTDNVSAPPAGSLRAKLNDASACTAAQQQHDSGP